MITKASTVVTYTASGSVIAFGLNADELGLMISAIGVAIGSLVAISSFAVSVWYKHQHLNLAKEKRRTETDGPTI